MNVKLNPSTGISLKPNSCYPVKLLIYDTDNTVFVNLQGIGGFKCDPWCLKERPHIAFIIWNATKGCHRMKSHSSNGIQYIIIRHVLASEISSEESVVTSLKNWPEIVL